MSNENQATELLTLKAKLYDANQEIEVIRNQATQLNAVLSEIVTIIGLQPNDQGAVAFEDVIEAIKDIVPSEDAVVVDAGE